MLNFPVDKLTTDVGHVKDKSKKQLAEDCGYTYIEVWSSKLTQIKRELMEQITCK